MEEENLKDKDTSIKRKLSLQAKKRIAWTLIGICALLFVLTTFEFIYPVKAFFLGVFGVMFYPLLMFAILFASAFAVGRDFIYSPKYVVYLGLCFLFFTCILHVAFTGFNNADLSYGEYLVACFNSVYTPGGLLIGIFTFPITSLLHGVAGLVIFGIALIISIYFVISYLLSVKSHKISREDILKQRAEGYNRVVSNFEDIDGLSKMEESEREAETLSVLQEEQKQKIEDANIDENHEDDIFIKEEKEQITEHNLAKQRLGLGEKNADDEEKTSEKAGSVLFSQTGDSSRRYNDSAWQNRAVKNEDRPQKVVFENQQKLKKTEMYERNREYLETLYKPNYDNRNPIINAENYEDYKEMIRQQNEKRETAINREYSLNVNQTLQSERNNYKNTNNNNQNNSNFASTGAFSSIHDNRSFENADVDVNDTNNIFRDNFSSGFEKYSSNLNTSKQNEVKSNFEKSDYTSTNLGQREGYKSNFDFDVNSQITRDKTQKEDFGIEPNKIANIEIDDDDYDISKYETSYDEFDNKISSVDDEEDSIALHPERPLPMAPNNVELSQSRYDTSPEEKTSNSSQKFLDKEDGKETPFDTTKLSSGDVATSLGKTYNLPKSLRRDNGLSIETESKNSSVDLAPDLAYSSTYVRPPIDLLKTYINEVDTTTDIQANIDALEQTLEQFRVPAKVEAVRRGAAVTRYELRVQPGTPVRKIHAHAPDIALALASRGEIRIETPIRGKSAVGVEVPNAKIDTVGLKDIVSSPEFINAPSPLTFALGKDVDGKVYCCNLQKMPHLLVAGSTGSGKSVCLNSLLLSMISRTSPEDLRLILVDPKRVEFGIYNDLPHLLTQKVITDPKKALNSFDWLINEMERRYTVFQDCFVKDIKEYNNQPDVKLGNWQKMPFIVLVVDEMADLVVTVGKKDFEEKIVRLTQKARAAGIHVILATQRPSVDIVSGIIKINLPARIAFAVTSIVDSRTILDQAGAEQLLGRGDMLYSPSDGEPVRVQGAFVDTPEVKQITDFIRENNPSHYDERIQKFIDNAGSASGGSPGNQPFTSSSNDGEFDTLMPDALRFVIESGQASISMLQRRFAIGFSRAGKIIDQMQTARFISGSDGGKPRTVFITMDEYNQIYGNS